MFIHSSTDGHWGVFEVFFTSYLILWIELLKTCLCSSFYGLVSIYLGKIEMKLLGCNQKIHIYLFKKLSNMSLNWAFHCILPSATYESTTSFPSPNIIISLLLWAILMALKWYLIKVSICIFLLQMTVFIYLLVSFIYSFLKNLFKFHGHLKIHLFSLWIHRIHCTF